MCKNRLVDVGGRVLAFGVFLLCDVCLADGFWGGSSLLTRHSIEQRFCCILEIRMPWLLKGKKQAIYCFPMDWLQITITIGR